MCWVRIPYWSLAGEVATVRPLRGWKEIAAYSHRSIRSLQREQVFGLPVHRLNDKRGQVFAYAEEMDAWEKEIGLHYPPDIDQLKEKIRNDVYTIALAKELDPQKLRELLWGISRLLDALDAQLAKVEGHKDTSVNKPRPSEKLRAKK